MSGAGTEVEVRNSELTALQVSGFATGRVIASDVELLTVAGSTPTKVSVVGSTVKTLTASNSGAFDVLHSDIGTLDASAGTSGTLHLSRFHTILNDGANLKCKNSVYLTADSCAE